LARAQGTLLIADEVMTGFGRTGKLFASHYLTERPDLMCLSKGLTGGTMALGVTTCTASIYNAFLSADKMKTLFHGHSFTANPLACTASLASLDLLLSDERQIDIQRIAAQHTQFAGTLRRSPVVGNVRQRGTLLAFDLITTEHTSYFNNIRDVAYNYLLDRGILMRPYCTTNVQLRVAYDAVVDFLDTLQP
jgi:adenosylmethionine-8-amino-7-oxononanoate aminotransferase